MIGHESRQINGTKYRGVVEKIMSLDLSVLVMGRNDDFGNVPGFPCYLDRVGLFYQSLNVALKGLTWEVVMVDYNSLPGRSLMSEIFTGKNWNHVVVTPSQHKRFVHLNRRHGAIFAEKTFYGGYALYVGLRAARGKCVLYTATDDIFTDDLSLIVKNVKDNVIYRANKHDLNSQKSIDEMLENSSKIKTKKVNNNFKKGCGDFILLSRKRCLEFGGALPLAHPKAYGADVQILFFGKCAGMKLKMLPYRFFNINIEKDEFEEEMRSYNYVCGDYDHTKWVHKRPFAQFRKWLLNTKDRTPRINYDPTWIWKIFNQFV